MAEIPDTVAASLRQFLAAVRKQRRVEAAYLYGSQTRGTATEWSDIDVAVVSPDFSDDLFKDYHKAPSYKASSERRSKLYRSPSLPSSSNAASPRSWTRRTMPSGRRSGSLPSSRRLRPGCCTTSLPAAWTSTATCATRRLAPSSSRIRRWGGFRGSGKSDCCRTSMQSRRETACTNQLCTTAVDTQ